MCHLVTFFRGRRRRGGKGCEGKKEERGEEKKGYNCTRFRPGEPAQRK
jgi:hypothetical protein